MVPYLDIKLQPFSAIPAMIVGITLMAWGGYLGLFGLRPANPDYMPTPFISPREYGLTITSPKSNDRLAVPVELQGTLRKDLPKGVELWLFNCSRTASWPQASVDITKADQTFSWCATYTPREFSDGDARQLQLFFVGANGRALINCYLKMNEKFAAPSNKPWEGIGGFTEDIIAASPPLLITLRASATSVPVAS